MSSSTANGHRRIVVLISGSGSNLQAIIDACQSGQIDASIAAVISNRPGCYGLERAERAGIEATAIDHTAFASREQFDEALADAIDSAQAELIVLAGFMRILSEGFVSRYKGKLLNIHPSLLPKYPGLHTHQRALDNGDTVAGVTVHFVTAELDGGPAIIQAEVPVQPDDTAEALAQRVLGEEHRIYPQAIGWFIDKRLVLDNGKATLDNAPLPPRGICQHD